MSRKSKGKTVSIETVEGPCEGLINSATDSDLELPRGYESQSQESKGFHKHFKKIIKRKTSGVYVYMS